MGFISLYTAFSGLQAAQAGMDTASHNVANAATPGYTRQRVDQASRLPSHRSFGPVGAGVDIVDITRSRDVMLDARLRGAIGGESRFNTLGNLHADGRAGRLKGVRLSAPESAWRDPPPRRSRCSAASPR